MGGVAWVALVGWQMGWQGVNRPAACWALCRSHAEDDSSRGAFLFCRLLIAARLQASIIPPLWEATICLPATTARLATQLSSGRELPTKWAANIHQQHMSQAQCSTSSACDQISQPTPVLVCNCSFILACTRSLARSDANLLLQVLLKHNACTSVSLGVRSAGLKAGSL
jgi:hypothetical protein